MKIGLVPMSAKPYHAGHDELIRLAARENDEVMLFVSLSSRERPGEIIISGNSMELIWKNYIEPSLPENVIVEYGGAPVGKVWKVLESAEERLDENTYTIYSDSEDIKKYNSLSFQKYSPNLFKNGQVKTRGIARGVETAEISGTKMRQYLSAGAIDKFKEFLPFSLQKYSKEIADILTRKSESLLRSYIAEFLCENKWKK